MDGSPSQQTGLVGYLGVLRRRKWIALQAVVLVPAAAVAFSLSQEPLYRASAEVLLSRQNLANELNGVSDPTLSIDPQRMIQTQASVARVPEVARRTLAKAAVENLTLREFLSTSSVSAKTSTDLLVFKVTSSDRLVAQRLATLYASEYIGFRYEIDTSALQRARDEVQSRLATLNAPGDRASALYAALIDKQQRLATIEALVTSNAYLIRPAEGARQTQPETVRNGILGLILGLVLGLGLASLREALDTRVHSGEEIARLLKLPILARIPEPPRELRQSNRLVMTTQPDGYDAEPYRILSINLEVGLVDRGVRSIMVTSALEGDGKSTTAANLAVSIARYGRRVILVDFDLRNPTLQRFFPLGWEPGLTDVALRRVPLEEALVPYSLSDDPTSSNDRHATNGALTSGAAAMVGTLEVLGTGPLPHNPADFVGSTRTQSILDALVERADLVVVDGPPLIGLGDALSLGGKVDGLVIVAQVDRLRRPVLREMHRLLTASPTRPLGVVIAGAERDARFSYGSYGAYGPGPRS